jgi:hypothetical protein
MEGNDLPLTFTPSRPMATETTKAQTTKAADPFAALLAELAGEAEILSVETGRSGRCGKQRPMPVTAEVAAMLAAASMAPTVGAESGSRAIGRKSKAGAGAPQSKAQALLQQALIPDGPTLAVERFAALACLCWPSLEGSPEERFLNACKATARLVGCRIVWRQDGTVRATLDDTAG